MNLKKALLVLLGLGCVAGLVFWFLASPDDFVNWPPVATGPWVAFGDSLTEGVGASPGQDFPAVLSRELGIPIMNLGRSGNTSSDALSRLEEVVQLRPRVVLLCFGGNDSLNGMP